MQSRRILILNHNLRERGTYFRAWKVATLLKQRGWEVTFITTGEGWYRTSHGRVQGIEVWETPSWSLLHDADDGWSPLGLPWRLGVAISKKWDAVYSFSHKPIDQLPARAARLLFRCPWICDWCDLYNGEGGINVMRLEPSSESHSLRDRVHIKLNRIDEHLEEFAATHSDILTVISTFLKERAIRLGRSRETVSQMISGADLDTIRPLNKQDCREVFHLDQNKIWLGYMANYHPDETLLLDAMKNVMAERQEVRLVVAGHEFYGGTQALVDRGIESRIHHVGRVPFKNISKFLGAADILLVPMTDTPFNRSRWPNKIGDHLAAGRPQVACNVGDVAEFMQQHHAGLGSAPNPEDFARKITELVDDEEKRMEMGREARRVAETEFNWNKKTEQLLALIEQSLQRTQ